MDSERSLDDTLDNPDATLEISSLSELDSSLDLFLSDESTLTPITLVVGNSTQFSWEPDVFIECSSLLQWESSASATGDASPSRSLSTPVADPTSSPSQEPPSPVELPSLVWEPTEISWKTCTPIVKVPPEQVWESTVELEASSFTCDNSAPPTTLESSVNVPLPENKAQRKTIPENSYWEDVLELLREEVMATTSVENPPTTETEIFNALFGTDAKKPNDNVNL